MEEQQITDVRYVDIGRLMAPGTDRRQPLRGFDDEYVDIVDYIIRCTHKIWEDKAIGLIYTHYTHNCIVHVSGGRIYGRDAVISGTTQAIAAFPDRRLYGDEVIWSGDEDQSYYSSHRLTHAGTNTGYSAYGPPTGRKVHYNAIANCLVKENRIVEEWLIRDELNLVRQLGLDPHETARRLAEQEAELAVKLESVGEVQRLQGQLPPKALPPANPSDLEAFVTTALHEVWNWRLFNKIDAYYAETYVSQQPSGRHLYGLGDLKAFILSILAAFPDAALTVDHFCAIGDETNGYRTATRWTLQGTHLGPGLYGPPSGKRIHVLGTSHHLIQNGRFVQEWTLFDEFSILKQIYR